MKSFKRKKLAGIVLSALLVAGFPYGALAHEVVASDAVEFTLDTYVVTASRIPTRITDAKADVSVVTRQEIEEMHMTDVEEALRTVPGVQFTNYGGSGGLNANLNGVRINGSKEVVVLVDGVRISDFQGQDSAYMYASLMNNMDNVERIEILRGSAGTIYGSGAKGGVINIITRKINETKTTLDLASGNFGNHHYKLNTMGREDKLGFNVYYDKTQMGDFEDGNGKKWENKNDSEAFGAKITYDVTDKHQLSLSYDQVKNDYAGYDLVYDQRFKGDYESRNLTIRDNITLSDKWSNSLTYRHNEVEGKYFINGHLENTAYSDYTYNFLSNQATLHTSRHTVVLGFDYSQSKDNRIRKFNGKNINPEMKNISYYIQDDWEIIPKVTLSGGVRYDKPSNDSGTSVNVDSHTSKSYKLSYEITDNDTIYAGRSDFYILPSMRDLYDSQYGNMDLEAAFGRNTTIGYNKKFDDNNIFTLNWFETESEQTIGYNNSGVAQNNGAGISRGWNAQYMTQINDKWSANIGWAHLYQYAPSDNLSLGYYPEDLMTFGIFYDYSKFSAGLDGYYFMRRINSEIDKKYPNAWPADDYAIFNLSATYSPTKNISIYAKVDNLFDKMYAEHTNVIHVGGKPGQWYSMPGRTFVLGMQMTF